MLSNKKTSFLHFNLKKNISQLLYKYRLFYSERHVITERAFIGKVIEQQKGCFDYF